VWRIGILSARARPPDIQADYYGAFPRAMHELGYVEGRNLVIEWRFAEGRYERLPAMAKELVELNVDAILALGPPGVMAARDATKTTPIVMVMSSDPVAAGVVKSLASPGDNVTGLSNLGGDLGSKHLELLREMLPKLSRASVLLNPDNPSAKSVLESIRHAARNVGVEVLPTHARTPAEIDRAFAAMTEQRTGGVLVSLDPFFIQQRAQIATLARDRRLPSISSFREAAQAGGLVSYGQSQADIYRRAAGYIDRILKGAKVSELPVEQPTKLELVVNRKTVRALGLSLPQAFLVRVDEFID
jgi:ABC-type uncharacterized transport system substrate-binding protein